MEYSDNQIFEGEYPPEAAMWCNSNGAYIKEIDSAADGTRRFQLHIIPPPSLDDRKASRLKELDSAFAVWRGGTATFYSSLGFEADADSRAMQDVTGLWTLAAENPDFKTTFMDAQNTPHELNQQQLKTLRDEMIQSATDAYQQKWKARAAIEAAESYDELMHVDIYFCPSDFRLSE